MTVAILGAGGFVGSHLVSHLSCCQGYRVVGLDVSSEKLATIANDRFTLYKADIRVENELLDQIVREADVVVNLVAYANPSLYVSAPLEVFELNFQENLRVVEKCVRHGTRLIQYSSAEVYGKAREGDRYSEDRTDLVYGPVKKQRWIYATAKLLLERVIYAYGERGDLDYSIIRPFNFLGSRLDYMVPPETMGGPRVFAHFMSALLTGGPLYLVDGGHAHRAFLHIEDANRGLETILSQPSRTRNEIYNLGNPGNDVTIRNLAAEMMRLYQELTGQRPLSTVKVVTGLEFYGEGYEDATRLPPDIAKISALGWRPRHDLETTLRDAMSYYLEHQEEMLSQIRQPDSPTCARSQGMRGL